MKMKTPSARYWTRRAAAVEKRTHRSALEFLIETVDNYDRAIAAIKSDIEMWYQRFAVNNEISLAEAKKLLTKAELEEFRWTVDEYIKLGMSGDPRWHKQLENASARVHLNRLEALEIQMREQVERIYRGRETATREYLANLYEDNYYHNVFDIEQGVGIGLSFTRLDQKRLDLVTQKPWTTDNKTFSDRIWTSKQALINSLNRNLTQMIARGEAPDRTIAAIAKEFEKDKNTVGRLVMTESAAFSAKARADAHAELGVERFEIVATLDANTSEICRDMDGKHFAEKDREIGVTCPPFHPWCRSTDVPYFDDEFTVGGMRVARDPETGKVYEVPANMTYREWQKSLDKRSAESYKGLAAKDNNNKPSKLSEPIYLGKANMNIDGAVERIVKYHENRIVGLDHEEAIVILGNGEVYKCIGDKTRVYPEVLGERLNNAIITHNHPIGEGEYSFSTADLNLFYNYDLLELRGIDEKYVYSIRKSNKKTIVPNVPVLEATFEDSRHVSVALEVKNRGGYYSRRKRK
jgi:SPP1 gp7 family putative phage head morphogenesis protein